MAQTPVQTSDQSADMAEAQSPPATSDLIVKCAALTKIFRDFWLRNRVRAVDEIDLDIHRGEVFGLLGPNGSGKSTTIKLILGLLHATSGRVAVFGKHPGEVSIKREIGYLPEETYLYRFLNGRETLDYYARLFHQDRRQRHNRIDMLLEMVGLDKVARRPVGEYSKGMQRRIGLAQALINDPQLLILDEPTTGLDPLGTRQIKDLIVQLRQRGKTILLSSHLLADVEDVTDRVAVMFGGKIRRYGQMDELLKRRDQTTLTMPALDQTAQHRVMQALEGSGITDGRFDTPRQKLEQFFLDIVEEARQAGLATSGAGASGQIAQFLQGAEGEADSDQTQGHAVIGQLVRSEQTTASTADPRTRSTTPNDQSAPAPTDKRKTQPSAFDESASAQNTDAQPQTDEAQSTVDADADSRVINQLTGRAEQPTAESEKDQPHQDPHSSQTDNADQGVIDELLSEHKSS